MVRVSVVSCVNDFSIYNACVDSSFRKQLASRQIELNPVDNTSCSYSAASAINHGLEKGAKEAFEFDPKIAVTGLYTSWSATKQAIRRAEYCRNYWTNSQIYGFAKKYISSHRPRAWVDLPAVGGFAFIRRTLWNELSGFDANLPDYGNETELCKRLSKRGFRTVWTKNSYIHHFGQGSYGGIMSQATMKKSRLAARAYIDNLHNMRQ